ncbi:MAG: tRNA pseudouridine(38-40) synthase TruA, partial [Lachnospiraceae bacterium]|nr:tRNA pseudouridine(38-40) synthase TruA [Lachnospiraceae bacterium]
DSCQVRDDWHPHKVESKKSYEYRTLNRTFPDPTRRLDTHHYHYYLDVDKMQQAARLLEGQHDFKSFCSNKKMKKSTVRTIETIRIEEKGTKVVFSYTGNGFLYNMVRILTGTLVEVGLGKRKPEEMKTILDAMNREAAGMTAPPEGLFLESVEY